MRIEDNDRQDRTLHATFVMEQHIGHRSFYENLRQGIDADGNIAATWIKVDYNQEKFAWSRAPLLPAALKGTLAGRAEVRQGLRRHRADVAVFNTQVPAALAGRLLGRTPYVLCTDITPHQYDGMAQHYGHEPDRPGLWSGYKHRANRNLFRQAARITPWSEWVRQSLIEDYGVTGEKIEVIPPGVDLRRWHPANDRPAKDRPVRILFVGGDFTRKGGDLLLEAFSTLPSGQAELIVVTRSTLPTLPGVTVYNDMQPNTEALIRLFQSCDLFVLPTRAEAFGIAAVEASASGLPVVATAVGGLPDIVHPGETGFLFAPGDVGALNRHLQFLITHPERRQQMSRAARARVEARFDARRNAERMVEILQDIVKGRKK